MRSAVAALLLAAATVFACRTEQASNFPVSQEVAAQYGCGKTCQESLNQTNPEDLEDFDTPFDFLCNSQ